MSRWAHSGNRKFSMCLETEEKEGWESWSRVLLNTMGFMTSFYKQKNAMPRFFFNYIRFVLLKKKKSSSQYYNWKEPRLEARKTFALAWYGNYESEPKWWRDEGKATSLHNKKEVTCFLLKGIYSAKIKNTS